MITSEQVLTHYDPVLPVRLACDASPTGIGAVLSHLMPDGSERPVAFASRSLTKTEPKYAQIDKETLSIVWGCETVPCMPLGEAIYAHYRPQAPHCHFPPRKGSSYHDRFETLAICIVLGWFRLQDRV